MLRVRDVSKSYNDRVALRRVTFDIAPGEIVALLGPNGAGKTTLISIVAGLRAPDRGTVHVAGIDVCKKPLDARRHMGIAPQELGIYLGMDVAANLQFFGTLVGLEGRALREQIDEVATALDLGAVLTRPADELSGGEKRRLHTAIAMLGRPELLLLDEPTVGVDVHTRAQLLQVVKSLADAGTAICYTTHYLHEVEALRASVVILDNGKVIAKTALDDLMATAGESIIEIQLDGAVPVALAALGEDDAESSLVRIRTRDVGGELNAAILALGDGVGQVRSIEVNTPSLESVYLSLTGRHQDPHRTQHERQARASGRQERPSPPA